MKFLQKILLVAMIGLVAENADAEITLEMPLEASQVQPEITVDYTSIDEIQVKDKTESHNFKIVNVSGDGNCNCYAIDLNREDAIKKVKQEVINEDIKNLVLYAISNIFVEENDDAKKWRIYASKIIHKYNEIEQAAKALQECKNAITSAQTHIENIQQGKLKKKYLQDGEYFGITAKTAQDTLKKNGKVLPKAKSEFIAACEQHGVIEHYLNFMSEKHSSGYIWLNASDPIFWAIAKVYNYKVVVISNIDCKYRKYEINPSGSEPKYIFFSGGHFQKLNSHTGSNSTTTDEFNHFSFSNSSTSSYSSTGSSHSFSSDFPFSKGLQEALKGEKPLYAITVTRTGSEVLTPVEIHTVFAVLRELFCDHDENYEKKLTESIESVGKDFIIKHGDPLDYSFLETSDKFAKSSNKQNIFGELKLLIDSAINKYSSEEETLNKIRQNTQLIVFNEYFFGGKIGFSNDYLESILLEHTPHFSNSIFFINFLKQSVKQVSICDLDRSLSILSAPFLFRQTREFIEHQHHMDQRSGFFAWFADVNRIIREHNSIFPKLLQYEIRASRTGDGDEELISNWIKYLSLMKETTYLPSFNYPCLENISISVFRDRPLTFYRKSTYANEFKKLTFKQTDLMWFLYLFGNGTDLLFDDGDEFAKILWSNVSSEICLDLGSGIRSKDSVFKNVHIIQSNYIKLKNSLEAALPPCKYIIHSDPYNANCYTMDHDKKLAAQQKVFEYKFTIFGSNYTIGVFKLH